MWVVMYSGRYFCMTIPTIKRCDMGGHEEITCQSCSCWDLKYPRVHQQLNQVLILLLQRGRGLLLIITKITHTSNFFAFLFTRILILMLDGFWPTLHWSSWHERYFPPFFVFLGRLNRERLILCGGKSLSYWYFHCSEFSPLHQTLP